MLIFLLAAVLIGGAFLAFFLHAKRRNAAAAAWPSVEGRITGSSVDRRQRRDSDGQTDISYVPAVSYAYNVGGTDYRGDRIKFGFTNIATPHAAQTVCDRYPAGASVPVYYNPAKPAESVLERKTGS